MKKYELYIDNNKVDLVDVNISLLYKSNLFTDFSKIVSNNSYTIKLPKTSHNLSLIECAHIPSSSTTFPYIIHKGRLLIDGIEVINNANIVLLNVSDYIEVALSWGAITNLEVLVNEGKSLKELSYGMIYGVDYIRWSRLDSTSLQFLQINYGFKDDDIGAWYHPVVTAKWIIDKIAEEYGIIIDYPGDKLDMLERMKIPLLTRNMPQAWIDKYATNLLANGFILYDLPAYQFTLITFNVSGNTFYVSPILDSDSGNLIAIKPEIDTAIKVSGIVKILVRTDREPDNSGEYAVSLDLRNKDNMASIVVYRCNAEIETVGANYYRYIFNVDAELNLGVSVDVSFVLYDPYATYDNREIEDGSYLSVHMRDIVNVYPNTNDDANSSFFYVPNLPDIKQIDFLKAISTMLGLFAIPTEENHLKFISYGTLLQNKSKANDWSLRLVQAYDDCAPRNISYSLDGFARNNWFKYKEDDSVKGDYNDKIIVDSEFLDYEKDMIELPFAACDSLSGIASIPLYSYNAEGELEYSDAIEPRIVLSSGNLGFFSGLEWSGLLNDYYSEYKKMINRPRIITENVRLNPVELKNLDMSVPIYLKQYGCYWAIIEIKTRENDCEVKLIKI